ncbi:MAG: TetR/AcrR family transcriptional regulator [Pseudomonadota bacterium]
MTAALNEPSADRSSAATAPGKAEQAILLAAASCFAERGFAATSVDEVARRMGYTKGRVYHYFRSKGELFVAAASYGLDRLCDEVEPQAKRAGGACERLNWMARAHVLTQIRDLPYHRVMLQGVTMVVRGATTPEERTLLTNFLERQRAYEGIFREVLSVGMVSGDVRPGNLSIIVKTLLLSLNGSCFWFAERENQGPEELGELADQIVSQALFGICEAKS